jgi:glycogen operon protein
MQWTQTHPDGSKDDLHFIAHAHWEDAVFELPDIGEQKWFRLVDTALPSPQDIAEAGMEYTLSSQDSYAMKSRSVAIFVAKSARFFHSTARTLQF